MKTNAIIVVAPRKKHNLLNFALLLKRVIVGQPSVKSIHGENGAASRQQLCSL